MPKHPKMSENFPAILINTWFQANAWKVACLNDYNYSYECENIQEVI